MFLAVIGMLVGWSATTPAHAIPAFARKYQTSCARCHTAFPKLNSYGESFKLRGYQTLGEEKVDVDVVDTNDPLLDLLADLPLSFSFQTVLHGRRGEPFDFQTPTGISFLLGGTLAPEVGVLAQYSPGGGLDKLNLIFANLLRTEKEPTSLNAVVGQFELMDFVASYHRPLTMGGYAIYNTRIGNWTLGGQERGIMFYGTVGSGIGVEALQEDAGPQAGAAGEVTAEELEMLAREFEEAEETQVPETPETVAVNIVLEALVQKGILSEEEATEVQKDISVALLAQGITPVPAEAAAPQPPPIVSAAKTSYDTRQGIFWQLALVNGNLDEEGGDGGGHVHGDYVEFDDNGFKDLFARFAYYRNDNRIGVFAYDGSSLVTNALNQTFTNDFRRLGVDFSVFGRNSVDVNGVLNPRWNLFGLYVWGRDNNPQGAHLAPRERHAGGLIELDYLLSERSVGVIRYDVVNSADRPELEVRRLTTNYSYYVRRNLKAGVEFTKDLRTPKTGGDALSLVLDTAF